MSLDCQRKLFWVAALSGALLAGCGKTTPAAAPAGPAAPVAPKAAAHAKPLGDWTDDHAAAVKAARASGKKILLYFTGSDWCINCWRLDDEVFSKPAWAEYAAKNLVLETVDLPTQLPLPDATLLQNLKLQDKYRAPNFPTLVLLDADENELAWVEGYNGEGVAGMIGELEHPKLKSAPTTPAANDQAPPAALVPEPAGTAAPRGQPLPLSPVGTGANGAAPIPNASPEQAVAKPVSPPVGTGKGSE